jgi:hypothetical protein
MATDLQYYSLTDVENIKFSGFQYTLPAAFLELIKKIESELQVTDFVDKKEHSNNHDERKYPNKNPKRMDHYNRNAKNMKPMNNEDWESIRNFKSTKIETKEGVEKSINNIRILLNKISTKNYETQKNVILESVTEYLNITENKQEEIERLTQALFDIVSTNKFFSEIYANLYNELILKFAVFKDILIKYIETYKESVEHIYYIDSNKDYDGYCVYIKKNDNRKAMTQFIVNMCKNNVLEKKIVTDLLQYFLDKSLEYIDLENRTNELEEITENLFIITSNIQTLMVNNEEWNFNILPRIIVISQMKLKEHKSLTNRVIFKYMDIIDSLEGE